MIKLFFVFGSDIYFIGGFGTVAWVDVKDYETLQPDKIAVDGGEQYLKVNFLNSNANYFFLLHLEEHYGLPSGREIIAS